MTPAWTIGRVRPFSAIDRYGLALGLLVLTYVQALLVPDNHLGTSSLIVLQLVTIYVVLSVSDSQRFRRAAGLALIVAVALAVVAGATGAAYDSQRVLYALYLTNVALYALAPAVILRHIFRRPIVDGETFLAAMCAYVIVGMFFAFLYRAIGALDSTSFFGSTGADSMADYLFFSFITVTTTGYGNLVPASTSGQSLAVLEAVSGQFFIAAVVAKIVTAWRPRWARPAVWDYDANDDARRQMAEPADRDDTDAGSG